jgi:hypothetical protein
MIFRIKSIFRKLSLKNKLLSQIYSYANRYKVKILSILSDEQYAKLKYKENTGRKLNIKAPNTFNEKLWWLKINNRDPLLTRCSDKFEVRNYIKDKGLEHILVPIYGVYKNAADVNFEKIINKAFIKTNHGSGKNMIWDRDKPFDRSMFIKKFNKYLTENYYLQSREWNYKNIPPLIIVEKLLVDNPLTSLIDYRFLCFDGKVKIVFVDIETAAQDGSHNPYAKRNVYDRNFNQLDIKVSREQFSKDRILKPQNFEIMVEYAEILSAPFIFSRVDLYNIDGTIYFGEITFYPGGCTQIFEPEKYEIQLGSWIDLSSKKICRKLNSGASPN